MRPVRVLVALLLASLVCVAFAGCLDDAAEPTGDEPDPEPTVVILPSVEKDVVDATLACGIGTPVLTVNPCVVLDASNGFDITVQPGLKTLLIGVEYTPATPAAHNIRLLVDSADVDVVAGTGYNYYDGSGGPGHVGRIDHDDIESAEHGWDNLTASTTLVVRLFAANEGSVLIQQAMKVHIVAYYLEAAPEDASPFEDPAAPDA